MTDIKSMAALVAAVEAGDYLTFVPHWEHEVTVYKAFSGDLNAAVRLVEALLPGWWWGRFAGTGEMYVTHMDSTDVPDCYVGPNPARALLLATLKAKAQL